MAPTTVDIVQKIVIVLFGLYVLSSVLHSVSVQQQGGGGGGRGGGGGGHGGPGNGGAGGRGGGGRGGGGHGGPFQFTHKEATCTAGQQGRPLLPPPEKECSDVADNFSYERKRFTGQSTGSAVETFVLLPKTYDPNRPEPYPVVYSLHPAELKTSHGADFFKQMEWRLNINMCALMRMNTKEFIYVYPRGGDACYVNSMDGVTSMAEDVVVKDVVSHVTQNYNAAVDGNMCFGMSMGAYGCLLFGLRYPELFPHVVVQSPGRYPRFVEWEQLIANEGPKETPFSSRDFLLQYVFNEETYNEYDLCSVAKKAPDAGLAKSKFVIFHGDMDPYAQQVDDIVGCLQDKSELELKSFVAQGCDHGALPKCMESLPEQTCMVEAMQGFLAR